jgi:predicted Ser/Thr protein kinase
MTRRRLEVLKKKELGRGNFGVVSLGSWKETEVAIKVSLRGIK